jgi:hypothetical protein
VSGVAAIFLVLFLPVSPGGCYWETGDYFNSTSGHTFSYLANEHFFSCNEHANRASEVGSYRYEEGVGWVVRLRGSQRRTLMKPRLLFVRFSDIDAGGQPVTAPFQWRDPFVWKTSPVLRRLRPEALTNAAIIIPEINGGTPPNHLPQRARLSRAGCKPRVLGLSCRSAGAGGWAGSPAAAGLASHAA